MQSNLTKDLLSHISFETKTLFILFHFWAEDKHSSRINYIGLCGFKEVEKKREI